MERQLALIEERDVDYRLDERTREIGRRGIAAARDKLKAAGAGAGDQRSTRRTAA